MEKLILWVEPFNDGHIVYDSEYSSVKQLQKRIRKLSTAGQNYSIRTPRGDELKGKELWKIIRPTYDPAFGKKEIQNGETI